MTYKEKVLLHHKSAFALQWTGYWRIYRRYAASLDGPILRNYVEISGPHASEQDAWKEAHDSLPDTPPAVRRCRSERIAPLAERLLRLLEEEEKEQEDEQVSVGALKMVLLVPKYAKARKR